MYFSQNLRFFQKVGDLTPPSNKYFDPIHDIIKKLFLPMNINYAL